jgi:FAD/FMN-containing dehydrogenase
VILTVSFYVFPFSEYVQVHTWDRTDDRRSPFDIVREYLNITGQALASAWLGDLLAATRLLPRFADTAVRLQRNTSLVMRSYDGFTRTIYPLHQELEFTVPSDRVWEVNDHLLAMYKEMYGRKRLPFTLFELRFTPADHRLGLISPGAGGPAQVYINLVCNQSGAYADFYAEAETYIRDLGGRPHLGKWCESWSSADLARMHGTDFVRFRRLRQQHDPHGRFRNDFTDRIFGPIVDDRPGRASSGSSSGT